MLLRSGRACLPCAAARAPSVCPRLAAGPAALCRPGNSSRRSAAIPVAAPQQQQRIGTFGSAPLKTQRRVLDVCHDSRRDAPVGGDGGENLAWSLGIGLLWVCLAVYGFVLSPNQTPYRDQIFIKLLTGISQDSTFSVNPVYFSVFNIIGIYTFIYQCLLIPGGRSANKIPVWPFVVLSYGLGAFALLPYFALWRPDRDLELPPKPAELEGWNKLAMKGAETKVLPGIALAAALYLIYNAATADGAAWAGYVSLFEESRLVHVSTIDCAILTSLCPFWMSNDAELRDWKDREKLLPWLSVLPVVGPATYLLLRPKTGEKQER